MTSVQPCRWQIYTISLVLINIFVFLYSHICTPQAIEDVCYILSTKSLLLCSWLVGPRPEFVDPNFVAQGEGRQSKMKYSNRTHTLILEYHNNYIH